MSRSCSCGGSNENCMFCQGTGVIDGTRQVPSGVPSWLRPSGRKASVKRTGGARQELLAVACPVCGVSVGRLERHLKQVHDGQNTVTPSEASARAATAGMAPAQLFRPNVRGSHHPEPGRTAAPPDQLRNEPLQEKRNRSMDATKDYAHSFREHGRYGSHPAHDDYDEGAP